MRGISCFRLLLLLSLPLACARASSLHYYKASLRECTGGLPFFVTSLLTNPSENALAGSTYINLFSLLAIRISSTLHQSKPRTLCSGERSSCCLLQKSTSFPFGVYLGGNLLLLPRTHRKFFTVRRARVSSPPLHFGIRCYD